VDVVDADSFICLAQAHGVLGHFTAALAGIPGLQIPSPFLDSLRVHRRAHLLSNLAMTAELFRVLELFRQSEIECVVVKGPVLSLRAYGDPAVRQYADLDLLLQQKDIPRAAEILVDAGYDSRISAEVIRSGKIPGEYRFRGQGTEMILELHTESTLRYFPLPLPIEKYFESKTSLSLDGRPVPALSAEHEFVLISVHGATHFWERLMWICDVAAMVHNHPQLDWNMIRRSAAEAGAERMVRVALLLAERSLGVPIPKRHEKRSAVRLGVSRIGSADRNLVAVCGFRSAVNRATRILSLCNSRKCDRRTWLSRASFAFDHRRRLVVAEHRAAFALG